jgi:hypothetical protein
MGYVREAQGGSTVDFNEAGPDRLRPTSHAGIFLSNLLASCASCCASLENSNLVARCLRWLDQT